MQISGRVQRGTGLLRPARREQGRERSGDQARLPQAGPRTASRRQPRRGRPGPVQGDHRRLRGAVRPRRSGASSTSAATRWRAAAVGGGGFTRFRRPRRRHSKPSSAAAPARAVPPAGCARAPTRCCGCGWTSTECATGVTKQVTVDTADAVRHCARARAPTATPRPVACDTCGGRGEVQTRAALAARPGHDVAAVPDLPRRRRGHPRSVPPVRRRRPGPRPPRDQRQDPGRGRRRHAGPAGRAGRGRPRRRSGRRPVRRGRTSSPTTSSSATATTCTAPSRCRWSTPRSAPRSPSTPSSTG